MLYNEVATLLECAESSLRLNNATGHYDGMGGMLEICINGVWTAICSSSWNSKHSAVACRQMGSLTQSMWPFHSSIIYDSSYTEHEHKY